MARLSFWVQALDNQSDDHVGVDGVILPTSTPGAKALLRRMSSIVRRGQEIISQQGIRIIADGPFFIIIIPCEQKDADGRQSQIHCIGELDLRGKLGLFTIEEALHIERATCAFASKLKFSVSDDTWYLLTAIFIQLKKKVLLWRAVAWGVVAIVLTLVILWLKDLSRYWSAFNI
jgi:hypothetical protein